jgi:hypothetical protein
LAHTRNVIQLSFSKELDCVKLTRTMLAGNAPIIRSLEITLAFNLCKRGDPSLDGAAERVGFEHERRLARNP